MEASKISLKLLKLSLTRLLIISYKSTIYSLTWNIVVMSRLVMSCRVSMSRCYFDIASLSLFWKHYYFSRCSSELAAHVPLPCSRGRLGLLVILIDCITSFLSPFLDVTRMSMSTVSSTNC